MFGKANSDNNGVFVFSGQAKPDANVGMGENSFDQNQGDANNSSNSNLFSGRKIDNNKGIFVFGAPENTFGSSNTAFRGENTIFTTKSSSPETKVFTFSGFNAQDSTKLDDNAGINGNPSREMGNGSTPQSPAMRKTTNQPVKPVPIAPSVFEFKGSEDSGNSTVQSNKLLQEEKEVYEEPREIESKSAKLKARGNEFYVKGQYEAALRMYDAACCIDPRNPIYLGNRAAARLMLGQYMSAIEDCTNAVAINPAYFKGYLRAGRAWYAIGETKKAYAQFHRCIEACRSMNNAGGQESAMKEAYNGLNQVKELEHHRSEALSLIRQANNVLGDSKSHGMSRRRSRPSDVDCRAAKILSVEALSHTKAARGICPIAIWPIILHVKALIASREYENYESAARLCLDEIMNREAESKSMDQQDGLHTFFMTNLLQLHLLCGRGFTFVRRLGDFSEDIEAGLLKILARTFRRRSKQGKERSYEGNSR